MLVEQSQFFGDEKREREGQTSIFLHRAIVGELNYVHTSSAGMEDEGRT